MSLEGEQMKLGEFVVRKSYGKDVTFRILELWGRIATLKGVQLRLFADSPVHDLEVTSEPQIEVDARAIPIARMQRSRIEDNEKKIEPYFELPGTILHLDGDANYLRKSIELYNKLNIPAEGYHLKEADMANALIQLLPKVTPDILVITGHDGIIKNMYQQDKYNLQSYRNSKFFVHAVHTARAYERNRDQLIIIAGACQSHFEALLQAGANFASSPARIFIHALDPVYIAAATAYTPIRETLNLRDVIMNTMSGLKGLGGIETRGSYRFGLPKIDGS
jgi:spore coat assembly protein